MTIPTPSIRKLFREHFPGEEPLRLSRDERQALAAALRQRFAGDDWVETEKEHWLSKEQQARHVHSFTLKDPDGPSYTYFSNTFRLMHDDGRIVIESSRSRLSAPVSSLDEVVSFILEGKRRLERQRALRSRREKVRGFKHAALVAKLKEMAREEKFDFATEATQQRVKLWVRLNENGDALEIVFAPKRLQDVLPRLPGVIRALRESWEAGLNFMTVSRRALPWGTDWIRHTEGGEGAGLV
jgi:hypothetical protein